MTLAKPRPPLLRSVAIALMATLLAGCMMWEPVPLTPQVIVDSTRGVRVTLRDGSRVNLRVPYMLRDSLIGSRYERGLGRVAIPLNEITMVEISEVDGHATASVVVGYIFVIAGLLSVL